MLLYEIYSSLNHWSSFAPIQQFSTEILKESQADFCF